MQARTILLIEDEVELACFIKEQLEAEGYAVTHSSDGMQGLQLARTMAPDLILLDVNLPRLDGFKIARLLKFDEQFKSIPIILWTWREADEDRSLGHYAGADEYIPKPFSLQKLLDSIKRLLGSNSGKP
ncbi:MAG: response regulator transcription factor [Calditrichaeota bacterium]|nr:response regulator transcription factor [Calditrichota bacterium]